MSCQHFREITPCENNHVYSIFILLIDINITPSVQYSDNGWLVVLEDLRRFRDISVISQLWNRR